MIDPRRPDEVLDTTSKSSPTKNSTTKNSTTKN